MNALIKFSSYIFNKIISISKEMSLRSPCDPVNFG